MSKKRKYLLPITAEIDTALRHLAVDHGLTIGETVVLAIAEKAERDGWLVKAENEDPQPEAGR